MYISWRHNYIILLWRHYDKISFTVRCERMRGMNVISERRCMFAVIIGFKNFIWHIIKMQITIDLQVVGRGKIYNPLLYNTRTMCAQPVPTRVMLRAFHVPENKMSTSHWRERRYYYKQDWTKSKWKNNVIKRELVDEIASSSLEIWLGLGKKIN